MDTQWLGTTLSILALAAFIQIASAGPNHPGLAVNEGLSLTPITTNSVTKDFQAALTEMQEQMLATPMSGNADRDFAMHMVLHHQGAIDMARIQLEHGRDSEMRNIAVKAILDHDKEIAYLSQWLEKH